MSTTSNTTRLPALVFLMLVAQFAIAQNNTGVEAEFIGSWTGEGTLFGSAAKFQLRFSRELGDKFLHLDFQNEYTMNNKSYSMQARGYYSLAGDSLKGYWFDSRGVQLPVVVARESKTLTSFWGSPSTERGKTIYALQTDGTLLVTDFVMRNNAYVQFGQARYRRVN